MRPENSQMRGEELRGVWSVGSLLEDRERDGLGNFEEDVERGRLARAHHLARNSILETKKFVF